jgi:(2Fe-2S) ferredoxin
MPGYERHIFVCTNVRPGGHPRGCCSEKGSVEVREALKLAVSKRGLKGRVRANIAGCLDYCEYGPTIVVYPEAVWYGGVRSEDVDEIVEKHLIGGQIVERLLLAETPPPEDELPLRLVVDGSVGKTRLYTYSVLDHLPEEAQIAEVGEIIPDRQGAAVKAGALLDAAGPNAEATHATVHAAEGVFAASVPLTDLAERGLLVYKLDGAPLPRGKGGPLRFLLPNAAQSCTNIKGVGRIEITVGPGKDTMPQGPNRVIRERRGQV